MTRLPQARLTAPLIWGGMGGDETSSFALPAGTVTFLMTDIAGSTRLWEAEPEAMAEAVPMHYTLLADTVARRGGVRPVEQGEGDSIVAAFSRASDALLAAVEAQRALQETAWPGGIDLQVRIALHTAEAQLRDEGNYFGVALSRGARLRAIAHGGQTVISGAVHDLVVDRLPESVTLLDCGTHRLRDLGRPERVFLVEHPDLPSDHAPLRSLDALPNNLPEQLTSFVGRETELDDIAGELGRTRLLTLAGAGGCGKTRLAAQIAADTLDQHPGGAWWVELAPVADAAGVDGALADALGVRPMPGQTPRDAVLAHIADTPTLVVLDNCEHLLDAAADVAEALLRACSNALVLATSRAGLGVAGETLWRVPSLSLPVERDSTAVDSLAQSDAVRLFIERALKVRPNFAVTNENAPAVAQLCHDLDGIPLAIELAAARSRMLTVEQIAAGLSDRFRLLTGGTRSAMPRHQTLRGSVDWSHDLLSDEERVLLRRLGIFEGGFTLDAAEEVAGGDGLDSLAVLDLLDSLVDKSLVLAEERGAAVRYRTLETVRQYAAERLHGTGEHTAVADRHRDHYAALIERLAPGLHTAAQPQLFEILDADAPNLTAALVHAATTDPDLALRLAVDLTFWWKLRGRFAEADAAYVRALAVSEPEPGALRARALWARAYLKTYAGDYEESVAIAMEASALAETAGDAVAGARALDVLATLQIFAGPAEAIPLAEQSRSLARAAGDEWCWIDATQIEAFGYLFQQQFDDALSLLDESLEAIEHMGHREFAAWHWNGHGMAAFQQGRLDESLGHYERSIAAAREVGEPTSENLALGMLGLLAATRGDHATGVATAEEAYGRVIAMGAGLALPWVMYDLAAALAIAGRLDEARQWLSALVAEAGYGDAYVLVWSHMTLATIELLAGAPDHAAEHAGAARECAVLFGGAPYSMTTVGLAEAGIGVARGSWTDAEAKAHDVLENALALDARSAVPEVFEVLAQVAAGLESYEEAARLLGAAERAREELGAVRWVPAEAVTSALRTAVVSGIGEAEAATAEAEGRALSTADAIAWTRRMRGERKRPSGGWEALTPTEVEVAQLAAQGLTNPEIGEKMFIARGTVKVHLAHIYAKLDIRNRSELTALVATR